MKKSIALLTLLALLCVVSCKEDGAKSPSGKTSSFKDSRDGKKYKTVKIGEQVWMAENLNFNANGSECYENKPENCDKYGRLYDWNAAREACPQGWHLPSDGEWTTLTDFVGGSSTAGTKLKAASGWDNNGNGTDAYDFAALPGGYGSPYGGFSSVGEFGSWWSGTEDGAGNAWVRNMDSDDEDVSRYGNGKILLLSVRCAQGNAR
jgi:uncharacterized protein (TIGR02145 family)